MKNIIFIAPPAAGKGTISEYLINNLNYSHLSTGDLLRKEIKEESLIGKKVEAVIKEGKLVDDSLITELLTKNLREVNYPFILDGYPRNLNQAKILNDIIIDLNIKDVILINLDIAKDILLKRVTGRCTCPQCNKIYNIYEATMKPVNDNLCDQCHVELVKRSDDNEETFNDRYNTYLKETLPIINYLKDYYKYYTINVNRELNEVFNDVRNIISED